MADAYKESELKGVAGFKGGPEGAGASEEEQLVLTIKGPRGKIVRIEKVDKTGKRHELEQGEWAKLISEDEVEEIEDALEESFEAGIAAVFGEEYEEDQAYEDDEDKALRRLLIGGLLRRRRVQRRILHRLLVTRLLRRQVVKRSA